jgi:hypothetical protein
MLDSDLKARIMESVRRRPSPPRQEVTLRSTALLVSAAMAPFLTVMLLGLKDGVEARPSSLVVSTVGGAIVATLLAAWVAIGRGGRVLGRPRVSLVSVTIAAPVLFVGWKLLWSTMYSGMTDVWSDRPGVRCLALTLLFAAWPLLAMTIVRRASDPTHPGSLGAALGVAAAMYAGVLVELWCPVGYVWHVLLGHALPIALMGITGYLIGQHYLDVQEDEATTLSGAEEP